MQARPLTSTEQLVERINGFAQLVVMLPFFVFVWTIAFLLGRDGEGDDA